MIKPHPLLSVKSKKNEFNSKLYEKISQSLNDKVCFFDEEITERFPHSVWLLVRY